MIHWGSGSSHGAVVGGHAVFVAGRRPHCPDRPGGRSADPGRDDGSSAAPPPEDPAERSRLEVLERYGSAFAGAPEFDRLTSLAADLCGTSMALVSLVAEQSQRYLSSFGGEPPQLSRSEGFCGYELARGEILEVPDAHLDPRFAGLRIVIGPPWIRFYAGAPLVAPGGFVLGRLCVMDTEPKLLSQRQRHQLETLADEVMAQLTLRRQAAELVTEVASRRASEATLAAHERLLEGVLASPDRAIYAMDTTGRFIMANDTAHRLARLEIGTMVGRAFESVFHPEVADAHRRANDEVIRTGEAVVVDEVFTSLGRELTFMVSRFPLRGRDDAVYGVAVSASDVTEQRAGQAALRESENRWHQLFVGSPVGIGLLDDNGVFRAVNRALCALFQRSEEELLGRAPDDFAPAHGSHDPGRFVDGAVATAERRVALPDGRFRWVWVTTARTPGPANQTWTLAHMQDVTERMATQQKIQDSEANLTAVAEVIQTIQAGGDARQIIVEAGRDLADASLACLLEPTADGRALVVTSSTQPEALGIELALDGPSAGAKAFLTGTTVFVPDTRYGPHSSSLLMKLVGPGASFCVVPVRSGDRVTGAVSVGWSHLLGQVGDRRVQVITLLANQAGVALRQVALLGELEQLAQTDALTGLPNRRSWDQTLDNLLHSMSANGHPLSVALLDLDHFKAFNDTYGHAAGDEFLRHFAQHASSVLRSADTVARWGGEEFAVALPDCQGNVAAEVLERIRMDVPAGQTCSVGYATWDGTESAADLMERVDAALYEAKGAGRDRIQLAAPRPAVNASG